MWLLSLLPLVSHRSQGNLPPHSRNHMRISHTGTPPSPRTRPHTQMRTHHTTTPPPDMFKLVYLDLTIQFPHLGPPSRTGWKAGGWPSTEIVFWSNNLTLHMPLVWALVLKTKFKQECIPVGCIPPAAVAIRGVSTRHPPGADPPGADPPAARHAGIAPPCCKAC